MKNLTQDQVRALKNMSGNELNDLQIRLQIENGLSQEEAIIFIDEQRNRVLKRFSIAFDGNCGGAHESCKRDEHHVDTCPAAIEY